MLIIEKYRLLFVSNPKTGTTMAQSLLLELDSNARLNKISVEREKGLGDVKLKEHLSSLEIKSALGAAWDDYKTLVFIRNPYDKVVSGYFFYKNGQPITRNDNKRKLQVYVNVFLVNILPFWLWFLVKRVKENHKYILDENDFIIVNHIGQNESLVEDLNRILLKLNIPKVFEKKNRINTSKHATTDEYFKNKFVRKAFDWKYKKEIYVFDKLRNIDVTEDLKGKNINEL